MSQPLNIYEVHIGSWKRHGDAPQGEPDEYGNYPGPMDPFPAQRGEFYTYDDLSVELVDYVRDMGYTHIEVMPLMEHPSMALGLPDDRLLCRHVALRQPAAAHALIDACHEAGIGVIMDWVPGGFCADSHGLATFNGHMLFEHEIHPTGARTSSTSPVARSAPSWSPTYCIGSRTSMLTAFAWMAYPACCTSTLASMIPAKRSSTSTVPRRTWTPARLSVRSTALWRRTSPT